MSTVDVYRFYMPDLANGGTALPEDQAHHALRVLRLAEGAPVVLFDGAGTWCHAIMHPGGRAVRVELAGPLEHDLPPRRPLTLVSAVPKGERADWLVEQASGLNVARIQWLDAERSVVRPKESGGKIEKWRRLAIESAKQCGRTWLMAIEPMRPLAEVLAAPAGDVTRLCLDPRSERGVLEVLAAATGPIVALVGPEGGWSPRELALLAATPGIVSVHLTPTILRIETACAAIAAVVGCA